MDLKQGPKDQNKADVVKKTKRESRDGTLKDIKQEWSDTKTSNVKEAKA